MEFTRISSYFGTNMHSNGDDITVSTGVLDLKDLSGRHVLVIEDIVDTGKTLAKFLPILKDHGLKSCEVCTLLVKRLEEDEAGNRGIVPKFVGFVVPDEFVVGYGLDFDELYRNLPFIAVLKPEVFAHLLEG